MSRGQVPGQGPQPAGTPGVGAGCECSRASPSVKKSGDRRGICEEKEDPQGLDSEQRLIPDWEGGC